MTRGEAAAWYMSRCPGGRGHEYDPKEPDRVRWQKGDCYECVISALASEPASPKEGAPRPADALTQEAQRLGLDYQRPACRACNDTGVRMYGGGPCAKCAPRPAEEACPECHHAAHQSTCMAPRADAPSLPCRCPCGSGRKGDK